MQTFRASLDGLLRDAAVLMTGGGRVKLADLGQARSTSKSGSTVVSSLLMVRCSARSATRDCVSHRATSLLSHSHPPLLSVKAIGTVAYMPPEAFDDATVENENYNATAWDLYALGIIVWELWYRKDPWKDMSTQKIFSRVTRGKRPPFEEPKPPSQLKELVEAMWCQDPAMRPSIREVNRTFLAEIEPIMKSMPQT